MCSQSEAAGAVLALVAVLVACTASGVAAAAMVPPLDERSVSGGEIYPVSRPGAAATGMSADDKLGRIESLKRIVQLEARLLDLLETGVRARGGKTNSLSRRCAIPPCAGTELAAIGDDWINLHHRGPGRRCAIPPCGGGAELAAIGDDWVKLRAGPGRRRRR